jgi:hypothetical protein
VLVVDGSVLTLDVKLDATDRWGSASPIGATAVVVAGAGLGQSREVVASTWNATNNTTELVVTSGWDDYLLPGKSVIAVVVSTQSRTISGNRFEWGMVVQWFGTTLSAVIADNEFIDMHSASGGALAGRGLCYLGPQPLFFAEYTGNHMIRSGGIDIVDDEDCSDPITCCNTSFSGPFVRAQTVRRNIISGLSEITGRCGGIALHSSAGEVSGASTDLVVESNTIVCPNASLLPAGTRGVDVNCSHCVVHTKP